MVDSLMVDGRMNELLSGRWLLVEGLPLVLVMLLCTALVVLIYRLARRRRSSPEGVLSPAQATCLQNRIYKRAGALLLVLGAAGGFVPSLWMFATSGQVWSVNHQAPHTLVDTYLLIHIPLAVLWALLVAGQLWSGQVRVRRYLHVSLGWVALASGVIGIGVIGGWVWQLIHDFADGLDSANAGAGIYTMSMGAGVVINGILAGHYARKRDLARHKDHALMALFWTMDPGIHRLNMWLMRLFGGDTWAPENTNGLGIAIAKLPANLSLIAWALTMAILARRLNGIVWSNVAGQFALWCFGTVAVVGTFQSQFIAWTVVCASAVLFCLLWFTQVHSSAASQRT